MNLKRMVYSIRYFLFFDQMDRADWARKKGIFRHVGEHVRLPASLIPLHSELIAFHDNVEVASGVRFVVHDAIHGVMSFKFHGEKSNPEFPEQMGCIEIMDNVFIGSGTTILGNVRIGSNVVVGANSLVNKDLPSNGVYGGSPAKRLGSFDDLVQKRKKVASMKSPEEMWKAFYDAPERKEPNT